MTSDRLVFAGSLTIDNVLAADRRPMPATPGGNVVYSALGARLWHDEIGIVTRAGHDFPRAYLEKVADRGIDLSGVRAIDGPHGMNVAFCYAADGSRVRRFPAEIMALIPDGEKRRFRDYGAYDQTERFAVWEAFSPDDRDFPPGWLEESAAIHCAAMPVSKHLAIVSRLRDIGGRRSWLQVDSPWYDERDLSVDHAARLLPLLDALLPSEADLALVEPDAAIAESVAGLRSAGVPLVVVKRGARGCEIHLGQARMLTVPALAGIEVADLTGAGDAFCGGFMAGLLLTGDVVEAARYGTVSASFAIESRGAAGLLSATKSAAKQRLDRLSSLSLELDI